jgi:hypothetical protein
VCLATVTHCESHNHVLCVSCVCCAVQLNEELGAHPGVAFLDWMKDTLNSLPRGLPAVKTWGDLLQRMRLRGSNPE